MGGSCGGFVPSVEGEGKLEVRSEKGWVGGGLWGEEESLNGAGPAGTESVPPFQGWGFFDMGTRGVAPYALT